jgi:hypothetical protein
MNGRIGEDAHCYGIELGNDAYPEVAKSTPKQYLQLWRAGIVHRWNLGRQVAARTRDRGPLIFVNAHAELE